MLRPRAYREGDIDVLVGVLRASRPPERYGDYPSPNDLAEAVQLLENRRTLRIWEESGRAVGFAFIDPFNNVQFEIADGVPYRALGAEMIRWGEACIRKRIDETAKMMMLDANCRADDAARLNLLEAHGFVREPLETLVMDRSLAVPLAAPNFPKGFHLRPVTGEGEAKGVVALHRAAFGTQNMTLETRLAVMRAPAYERDLDLLVTAPDGSFAAYLTCSIEDAGTGQAQGFTDSLAVHPEFQGRGLAKALLLEGLTRLKARGLASARLGTTNENRAMQGAARSVGFKVTETKLWFAKAVAPG